jgi:DinB family protein
MNKTDLLYSLQQTKVETISFFDLADDKLALNYGEGKWTIRQILHHLADTELVLHTRIKKIIAEQKPLITAFDQDDWDKAFDYFHEPLGNKKQAYEVTRQLNYELTDKYYDLYGHKEFIHSETGLRTAKDEFEKIAWHNQKHIDQIKLALSK